MVSNNVVRSTITKSEQLNSVQPCARPKEMGYYLIIENKVIMQKKINIVRFLCLCEIAIRAV